MTSPAVKSMVDNFLHDSRTQHKISKLELGDLTCLIK
jgi:hypothetical protein